MTRGKTKHIYDMDFKVACSLLPEATDLSAAASASAGDDEMDADVTAAPAAAATGASAPTDSSAASSAPAAPAAAAAPAAEAPAKRPRVLLHFRDVSNTSEDAPREVKVEWGDPAPDEKHRAALRDALAVENAASGLTAAVRRAVEEVVADFKRK